MPRRQIACVKVQGMFCVVSISSERLNRLRVSLQPVNPSWREHSLCSVVPGRRVAVATRVVRIRIKRTIRISPVRR